VALNLLLNAEEAIEEAGAGRREVVIRTAQDSPGSVAVSFEDSGIGIDEAKAERLFEPFYTTKARGLGIGLSVCRTIVQAHGGRIWATANPERGATFHVTLPCHQEGSA
jgi:signal transduction histidine kinase